jgi:cytochrome P450
MAPLFDNRCLDDFTDIVRLTEVNQSSDSQAAYAHLRKEWGEMAPIELEPGITAWLVLGYEEIIRVSRDERLFSRNTNHWRFAEYLRNPESALTAVMTPRDHAYFSDGEAHRRLRAPIDEGLAGLDEHEMSRSTKAICLELIEAFASRGEADLVAEYAVLVPMLAVANWFGIGTDEGRRLMGAISLVFTPGEESVQGFETVQKILTDLMVARQERPTDDLATAFLRHPNYHTPSEVAQAIILMMVAGYEATISWIAQTLRLVLTDPRFGGRLRGGRLSVEDALDEVLWRRPPAANLANRFALADCEIAGRPVRKGDALVMSYAAANIDPRVHSDDPWLAVGNRAHLAWGVGPHVCPAHRPGRAIVRIAVETVLTRLHDLKVTIPAEDIVTMPSMWTVCPAKLPVRFTGFA